MSEEIEDLEKRLEKLQPLEQEALAAKILDNWQIVKGDDASAAPARLFARFRRYALRSAASAAGSRRFRFARHLPGRLPAPRAMFLGMTFFHPPKVEIREIVREVRV